MERVREHWSSRLGFLFAAVGSAVGLGVLWKFPYTVGQNGGGLFLISYIGCILAIGVPVFIAEILMGRGTQKAAIGAFSDLSKNDGWKIGGWLGVISSFIIMSFYSVIAGWGMCYVFMSICGFFHGKGVEEIKQVFHTLERSGDISVAWHFLFTALTMSIVFAGVRKGIERWTRVITRALFLILIALVIYNMTLPGFGQALSFIFYPNVETFQFSSMLEALGLAFFTLSLGQGIMFSYGSYISRDESLPQMAFTVAAAVIIVSILAALVVFPVVFSFGFEPAAGTGLVFETLPYLFARLPGSEVLCCAFFSLFVFTAITSSIAFIEVCSSNLMQMYSVGRKQAVIIVATATFILGIPSAYAGSGGIFPGWTEVYGTNFLNTMDNLISTWLIPVGGLITALFIGWGMNKEHCREEFMKGVKFEEGWNIWFFLMKWIVPVMMFLIILQKSELISFG